MVFTYYLLEDRGMDDITINVFCFWTLINHRGLQNEVRSLVIHAAVPRVPVFGSYHILTPSVIYYRTDARQHGIYLFGYNWMRGIPALMLRSIRTGGWQRTQEKRNKMINFIIFLLHGKITMNHVHLKCIVSLLTPLLWHELVT